jgi:hypothetical protein
MDRSQLLNDAEQAMRLVLDGRQSTLWTAMPGIVQSVDFGKMTCSVQPAIQGTVELENGTYQSVNLPLLVDVPICFPSAGGFIITMPLAANDEVLVVFASRCIDAWWQSGSVSRPMEARMHDLSDGFAIPGPRSQPNVVGDISSSALQIRNDAGTAYVEISASGAIKLKSSSTVAIDAPATTVSGTLVVTGALTAATLATAGAGGASIGGGMNVTGAITAGSVTAGGIGLATHKHTGVTTGGGTSGGPTP